MWRFNFIIRKCHLGSNFIDKGSERSQTSNIFVFTESRENLIFYHKPMLFTLGREASCDIWLLQIGSHWSSKEGSCLQGPHKWRVHIWRWDFRFVFTGKCWPKYHNMSFTEIKARHQLWQMKDFSKKGAMSFH